jgi:DNA-binding XRE family transcriptional regulator
MTSTLATSTSLASSFAPRRNFFFTVSLPSNTVPRFSEPAPAQSSSCDVGSRFGLRLREFRRARKITQLQMAVDFGIDRSFISDVENGKKSISLRMLEILALGLNVSLSELLTGL